MNIFFWELLCLALCLPGLRTHPRAIGLAVLLFVLNEWAVMVPFWRWDTLGFGPQHNWTGKLLATLLALGTVYGLRWVGPAEAGLGRPAPGSGRMVGLVLLVFVLAQFANGYSIRHHYPRPTTEALLYELTMPGLAEELFMRGTLLGVLGRVFPRNLPFLGTRTSWGGLAGLALFIMGHIFGFASPLQVLPSVHFSFELVAGIGLWGALFLWVRERSGSVWVAVVAHNLANFALYLGRWLP